MTGLFTSLDDLITAATDPQGVGLPIVIGLGLGMILYLMRSSTKEWKASDEKVEEGKEKQKKVGYPFKPF